MPSELDRRYDNTLAAVTGPGGTIVIGKDERGQAIVTNFPATLPALFRTFCALHPDNEAIVAGDERLTFAELDAISECAARIASAMSSVPCQTAASTNITTSTKLPDNRVR